MISSTCFGQTFAHLQEQLPSYRTHSATLPRSEPLPTTTTGHYTTCCKKNLSLVLLKMGKSLPETCWADHWRSIKLLLLHLVGFCFTSPTLMMHGQTQIKLYKSEKNVTRFTVGEADKPVIIKDIMVTINSKLSNNSTVQQNRIIVFDFSCGGNLTEIGFSRACTCPHTRTHTSCWCS